MITADVLTTNSGEMDILVKFPPGFNFTKGANSAFSARATGPSSSDIQIKPSSGSLSDSGSKSTRVTFSAQGPLKGVNKIQIDTKLYYCEEGEACLFEEIRIEAAFAADLTSGASINKVSCKQAMDKFTSNTTFYVVDSFHCTIVCANKVINELKRTHLWDVAYIFLQGCWASPHLFQHPETYSAIEFALMNTRVQTDLLKIPAQYLFFLSMLI